MLRPNSGTKPASDKGYRYRLWFTSADGTKWVPANTSTSTNATSTRTPNTRAIDPFGSIIYYSTNGTTNANANLSTTTQWEQYTLSLGYSFNTTGAALVLTYPAPVYIKCTPLANGSATLDGYTQSLPNSNDGKIYIFLGTAYNATNVELVPHHPVYYHDGTALRLWTNAASGGGGASEDDELTLSLETIQFFKGLAEKIDEFADAFSADMSESSTKCWNIVNNGGTQQDANDALIQTLYDFLNSLL